MIGLTELIEDFLFVGSGIFITLQLVLFSTIISLALGLCFAIMKYNNIGVIFINFFVSIIRGTPAILQLSFVYFAFPNLIGIKLDIIVAGSISFGLNHAAYFAEIFRSGIQNIPRGQFEASQSLRIPKYYMYKDIILPQVIKNTLPTMINELASILKHTALISTIGGADIMRKSHILSVQKFTYFTPLIIAGFYYQIAVLFLEKLSKKIEKKDLYVKN
jgi:polar amino acid transport system permease protein